MALNGFVLNTAKRDKQSLLNQFQAAPTCNTSKNMPVRLKKLIGSILIVVIAFVYALVATTIAAAKLADASGWIHLLYFLLTGLFWVVPAMFIITWMTKPGKNQR